MVSVGVSSEGITTLDLGAEGSGALLVDAEIFQRLAGVEVGLLAVLGAPAQVEQAISQDAFAAYTAALTAGDGITIDQAAINAVHASLP